VGPTDFFSAVETRKQELARLMFEEGTLALDKEIRKQFRLGSRRFCAQGIWEEIQEWHPQCRSR
jgi:hypothetical protein